MSTPTIWEVIGGGKKGGLQVRDGQELGSSTVLPQRLAVGATFEEQEQIGDLMQFVKVSGEGPEEGWIVFRMKGQDLIKEAANQLPWDPPPLSVGPDGQDPLPIAIIFPGQGSQYVGMLQKVKDRVDVREMMLKAEDILGYDLLELCLNGPDHILGSTKHNQPALFCAGLLALELMKEEQPEAVSRCSVMAGLSIGEYIALCAAGVMTFADGLEMVKLRAEAMDEAGNVGAQRMASIVGLEKKVLLSLIERAKKREPGGVCQISIMLFRTGFTVAGSNIAIEALEQLATEAGATQVRVLSTSGAFHTPLMHPAQEALDALLEERLPRLKPPNRTVWMNATAKPVRPGTDPKIIVELLKKQLTSTVLWEPAVKAMIRDGMTDFYEVGPNKQMKAMMKRISENCWKDMINVEV